MKLRSKHAKYNVPVEKARLITAFKNKTIIQNKKKEGSNQTQDTCYVHTMTTIRQPTITLIWSWFDCWWLPSKV